MTKKLMFNKDNFKVFTWSKWMDQCLYVGFLRAQKSSKMGENRFLTIFIPRALHEC